MSRYILTNNSPDAMREVVETFHATTVAPRLLLEEGWNVFDYRLSDEEVASVVKASGIKPGKWFAHKHIVRLCRAIDAVITVKHALPLMIARGHVEVTVGEDGEEKFHATEAGRAHAAALRANENAA